MSAPARRTDVYVCAKCGHDVACGPGGDWVDPAEDNYCRGCWEAKRS